MTRGRPKTSRVVRHAIGQAFDDLIANSNGNLSNASVARELGVSRETVRQYRSRRIAPSHDTLVKAMRTWGFPIKIGDRRFTAEDIAPTRKKSRRQPIQLDLQNLLGKPAEIHLPGPNVRLRISTPRNDSLEIAVKLDLTA